MSQTYTFLTNDILRKINCKLKGKYFVSLLRTCSFTRGFDEWEFVLFDFMVCSFSSTKNYNGSSQTFILPSVYDQ